MASELDEEIFSTTGPHEVKRDWNLLCFSLSFQQRKRDRHSDLSEVSFAGLKIHCGQGSGFKTRHLSSITEAPLFRRASEADATRAR